METPPAAGLAFLVHIISSELPTETWRQKWKISKKNQQQTRRRREWENGDTPICRKS